MFNNSIVHSKLKASTTAGHLANAHVVSSGGDLSKKRAMAPQNTTPQNFKALSSDVFDTQHKKAAGVQASKPSLLNSLGKMFKS
jgi:hypothetical protein